MRGLLPITKGEIKKGVALITSRYPLYKEGE